MLDRTISNAANGYNKAKRGRPKRNQKGAARVDAVISNAANGYNKARRDAVYYQRRKAGIACVTIELDEARWHTLCSLGLLRESADARAAARAIERMLDLAALDVAARMGRAFASVNPE